MNGDPMEEFGKTDRQIATELMLGVKKDFSCFTIDVVTRDGNRRGFVFQPSAARVLHDQMVEIMRRHPGFGDPSN